MHQDKLNKLTLLMLYLNSWEEKEYGELINRAWKGYDFGTLDKLEEEGFITKSKTAKSLCLTKDGIEEAKRLDRLIASVIDGK